MKYSEEYISAARQSNDTRILNQTRQYCDCAGDTAKTDARERCKRIKKSSFSPTQYNVGNIGIVLYTPKLTTVIK